MKDKEIREILHNACIEYHYNHEYRNVPTQLFKFLDNTLTALKALDRIDEGKLEEIITRFMQSSTGIRTCLSNEIPKLAHTIAQKKDEWLR